jgi:hypothetical protein
MSATSRLNATAPQRRSNIHTLADLPPLPEQGPYPPAMMRRLEAALEQARETNQRVSLLLKKINAQVMSLGTQSAELMQASRKIEEISAEQEKQLAAIQQAQNSSYNYLFGAFFIAGFVCYALAFRHR